VPTVKMDLVADDRRGPPAKRVKWVEDFDLEPQTPGIMASPRMSARNTGATCRFGFCSSIDKPAGVNRRADHRCLMANVTRSRRALSGRRR
jgi:hypothetical protein